MRAGVERLTYTAKDLAEAMGLSVITVRQYASRFPNRLPPKLTTPLKVLLWDVEEVKEWIQNHK